MEKGEKPPTALPVVPLLQELFQRKDLWAGVNREGFIEFLGLKYSWEDWEEILKETKWNSR